MSLPPLRPLTAGLAVLQFVLIEARLIGWQSHKEPLTPTEATRLADLMDAVHNIPELLLRWETVDEPHLLLCLKAYDEKWLPPSSRGLVRIYEEAASKLPAG